MSSPMGTYLQAGAIMARIIRRATRGQEIQSTVGKHLEVNIMYFVPDASEVGR
jgi:hypothetical protein